MLNKRHITFISVSVLLLTMLLPSLRVGSVWASCGGTFTCSKTVSVCDGPPGCDNEDPVNKCTICHDETATRSVNCNNFPDQECSIYIPTTCAGWRITSYCNYVPPSTPTYCGDGICNGSEGCATCPGDCGTCGGGSYGNCGSCGNCDNNPSGSGSHPASECVSTPGGGCTWDIGCRGGGGGGGGGGPVPGEIYCDIAIDAIPTIPVCGTTQVRVRVTREGKDEHKVNSFRFTYQNVTGGAGGLIATVNPTPVDRVSALSYTSTVVTGLREGQYRVMATGYMDSNVTCQSQWVTATVGSRTATPPAPHPNLFHHNTNPPDTQMMLRINGMNLGYWPTNPIIVPYDSSAVVSWYSYLGPCSLSISGYNGSDCAPNCVSDLPVTCQGVYAAPYTTSASRYLHHITGDTLVTLVGGGSSRTQLIRPSAPAGVANDKAVSCYPPCHADGTEYGAWNATCDGTRTEISRSVTTWANCASTTTTETQSCLSTIQGQVFDASGFLACPATADKNNNALANVTVDLSSLANGQHYTVTTDGSGHFAAQVIGGNTYRFSLSGGGNYDFTAPTMYCNATTPVAPTVYVAPSTSYGYPQIGVQTTADPWWQVEGGPVKVLGLAGTVLRSLIPNTCSAPGCQPYLIRNLNGDDTDGFVLTGGGNIDVSNAAGSQNDAVDQNRHNWLAKLNSLPNREDYSYFYRLLDLPTDAQSDFGAAANNAAKPTGEVVNEGADAYFHRGDLFTGSDWNVEADESILVMVDGDVVIRDEIHVAEGGYLMIIATGDITFDSRLGHADPAVTEAVVEGVFVADGSIRLESRGAAAGGDGKFVGEGTFVGWSGIDLARDYDNGGGRRTYNNLYPTEVFRYRPDFLLNAPETIKRSRYTWQEINP